MHIAPTLLHLCKIKHYYADLTSTGIITWALSFDEHFLRRRNNPVDVKNILKKGKIFSPKIIPLPKFLLESLTERQLVFPRKL